MRMKLLVLILCLNFFSFAQKKNTGKTQFQYKKYEKLYLDELSTQVNNSGVEDLTVDSNLNKEFQRALPSRDHFKPEVIKSIRRIK